MTNSAPEPQENNIPSPEERQRRRAYLTFDEMVAIIVAFGTIGAILLWSLTNKKEGWLNAQWQNNLFSTGNIETTSKNIDNNTNLQLDNGLRDRDNLELEAANKNLTTSQGVGSRTEAALNPEITSGELSTSPRQRDRQPARSRLLPAPVPVPSGRTRVERPEAVRPPSPQIKRPETAKPPAVVPVPVPTTPDKPEAATSDQTGTKKLIFKDVPESYWAYPFITKLAEKQLIAGTSLNKFEPDKLITRAEMATLIGQAFALPSNQATKNFQDVSSDNALVADINKALGMGFMKGYSQNEFRPLENIPRYQVLVTLASGLNLPQADDSDLVLQQFGDNDNLPQWAKQQVAAATQAGVVVNRPNFSSSQLQPNEPATRAEVAASIYQALVRSGKLEPIDSQYIVKP